MSLPLRLFIVRHGETAWSITGQHTGRTDLALTEGGQADARALVPWLAGVRFSRVFSSPLQRARQTAALALPEVTAEIEPDLAEWDYGAYEGLRSPEIRTRHPHWSVFQHGCPAGESPDDVGARADRLIARLRGLTGDVALFSHGQFSSVLATRWIGLPVAHAQHLTLATGSLSILRHNPSHPETPIIALWNATPASFPCA